MDIAEAIKYLEAVLDEEPILNEYRFIQDLRSSGVFAAAAEVSGQDLAKSKDGNLALFYEHFIARHIMHRLALKETPGAFYEVDAFGIKKILLTSDTAATEIAKGNSASLRDYYLDLNNLASVSGDEVQALLDSFWEQLASFNNIEGNYLLLDLEFNASEEPAKAWDRVQRAYRSKMNVLHPDKGGNAEAFNSVREAYESLKAYYKKML